MKTEHYFIIVILFSSAITGVSASSSSDYISVQNLVVMPGNFPDFFCQAGFPGYDATIVNQTGFAGLRPIYFGHRHVSDYMISPGHNATLTYELKTGIPANLEHTDVTFFHDGGQVDHLGLQIHFSPILGTSQGALESIMFSTSASAVRGTYWMVMPPGYCESGLVALFTVGDSVSPNLSTLSSFTASMDKQVYSKSDDLLVQMLGLPYDMLKFEVLQDNTSVPKISDTIMVDPDGESAYWLHANNFIAGNYNVIVSSLNKSVAIPFTIKNAETVPNSYIPGTNDLSLGKQNIEVNAYNEITSPLKQFKSGIAANDIICRSDLQLLIENHQGLPICIKPDSVFKLRQNWSYPTNCKYIRDPFTAGVVGLVMIEKNASNPSSDKSYSPKNSTIVIGWNNTVSWTNLDDATSSVTSDWNLFDSGPILPGNDWHHSFECAGNYGYHSEPHPWMKGSIRVLPPSR